MIHVAVGVIFAPDQRILITRRPARVHQGDRWEFPGGKVEAGETVLQALRRELAEELAIDVHWAEPLCCIRHDYDDRQILLDVWRVHDWSGQPRGMENQPLRWVSRDELLPEDFPEANRAIIRCLWLTDTLAITPATEDRHLALDSLRRLVAIHDGLVQLRQPALDPAALRSLLESAATLSREIRRRIIVNAPAGHPGISAFGGCHLASHQLMEYRQRPVGGDQLLGASCHTREELEMAVALGADYVTLSPVQETASHPGAIPLGWQRFAEMIRGLSVPVYALGGLQPGDLPRARAAGARGVAGIRHMQGR